MTVTSTTPGAPPSAPSRAVVPPPSPRTRWRAALRRTPGKLRLLGAVAVLAALFLGVLGFQAGAIQSRALATAGADMSQLVDVQSTRNSLVAADATATNAFLVGGLEPADQRARYDDEISFASTRLAELAGSNPRDAAFLGQANSRLTQYTGLIEQARANNRQGFPVGSAYLDQASAELRDEILPKLDEVVLNDANSAASSFTAIRNVMWFFVAALLCLAAIVVGQVWLARRTHRVLNVGLFAASVVMLVAGGIGAIVVGQAGATAHQVRNGPYAATLAASHAYSLANEAKSMESFTLIKRGSGQAAEEAFVAATADATERLDTASSTGLLDGSTATALDDWVTRHQEIRALDDGGDWDGAVALATSTADDSPNAAFEKFAGSARGDIKQTATATRERLASAETTASVTGWALLVAGLLSAALAWRGVSVRLKEYR